MRVFVLFFVIGVMSKCFSQSAFINSGESATEWDVGMNYSFNDDYTSVGYLGLSHSASGIVDLGMSLGRTFNHSGGKGTAISGGFRYHFIKEYDVLPIGLTFNGILGTVAGGNFDTNLNFDVSSTFYKTSLNPENKEREIYFYSTMGYTFTGAYRGSGFFLSSGLGINVPSKENSMLVIFGFTNKFEKRFEDTQYMVLSFGTILKK